MKPAYYNEHDGFCAAWLRNLINAGLIPAGDVDERDIRAVHADDLAGYGQRHLFAGVGGWAYACRLAGYPDDADILTGSPPCQPFSVAGRQAGVADDRHLWPEMARLAASLRPAAVAVENVANIVGLALDGMLLDLETAGFCARAFVVPACAVDAPHRRDRVWIAAKALDDAAGTRRGAGAGEALEAARDEARRCQPERRGGDGGGPVGDPGGAGLPGSQQRGEPGAAERGQQAGPAVAQPGRAPGLAPSALVNAESVGRGEGRAEHELRGGRPAAAGAGGAGAVADAARFGGEDQRFGDGSAGQHVCDELGTGGRNCGRDRAAGNREAAVGDAKEAGFWSGAGWIAGADGKARRVPQSGVRLLASRVPARVGRLRAYGNAICPQTAAEILKAMRCAP